MRDVARCQLGSLEETLLPHRRSGGLECSRRDDKSDTPPRLLVAISRSKQNGTVNSRIPLTVPTLVRASKMGAGASAGSASQGQAADETKKRRSTVVLSTVAHASEKYHVESKIIGDAPYRCDTMSRPRRHRYGLLPPPHAHTSTPTYHALTTSTLPPPPTPSLPTHDLGEGNFGTVRRCQNKETEEWFALKTINKAKVSKIQSLVDEVKILLVVNHPNVINVVDVFEDETKLDIVTELCVGGELFDRIIAKFGGLETRGAQARPPTCSCCRTTTFL